jgi:hypothetical protein
MITISTARAFFLPIVESLQLLQSLTQSTSKKKKKKKKLFTTYTGCWKETPLLQLPHFNEYSASNASARKYQAYDVIAFSNLPAEKKKEFYDKEEFKPEQVRDIENVLEFLPTKVSCEYRFVALKRGSGEGKESRLTHYSVAIEGEELETIVCGAIVTFFFSITRNCTDPAKANSMVSVKRTIEPDTPVSIKKKNALDAARPKRIVHAPHFWGDQREECWWIVIGM